MSSRSNYSLHAPYVSGGSNMSGPSQSASRIGVHKEQEVDALTDLLVQGMESRGEQDSADVYGICVKCGEKVCFARQTRIEHQESIAFLGRRRKQRLHSNGSNLPHKMFHLPPLRHKSPRKTFLFPRRQPLLRRRLFGTNNELFLARKHHLLTLFSY